MSNNQTIPQATGKIRKRDQMRIFFNSMLDKFRKARVTEKHARWESWDLDPAFFKALSQWTLNNPGDSLDRFLERTIDGIEIGKEFLEMVPDGPVPIRGFCKALAHLLKLGATVGRAQLEVYGFAKYVVHWVGNMKLVFQSKDLGPTTLQLQKVYLKEMSTLVDEICTWAAARLEDNRWSIQGLTVGKEIEDFKARIAVARGLFVDVATVTMAQNQDLNVRAIQSLILIIQDIKSSQMNILKFLEEQKEEEVREKFLHKVLSPHAADKTAYDEQGKRLCDDNTRVEILQGIKTWVFDISGDTQRFLWLTGDPGCGKSAITASIARECKNRNVLWAQFFINRNLEGTTDPASYFPSIARQLAERSPAVALRLFDALKARPALVDDISQGQAGELFVNSLKVASSTEPSKPVVVIIDGLDETMTARLESTAIVFAKAVLDLPSNVKVFISSRTETTIRRPFSDTFSGRPDVVKHIHLDTQSSIQDVSHFLENKMLEIASQNQLDILKWKERLEVLCTRAAGLFIWAVTVIGFIKEEIEASGTETLDMILDTLTANDLDDINTLYGTILQIVFHRRKDPWEFERFRKIVGCIICLREPLCIADIACLLNLQNPKSGQPVDVVHFISRLRTVLVSGADEITPQTIPWLHKSFFEYITSKSADNCIKYDGSTLSLRVYSRESNDEIALQCLSYIGKMFLSSTGAHMIGDTSLVAKGSEYSQSHLLYYSCHYAMSHLVPQCQGAGVLIKGTLPLKGLEERLNSWNTLSTVPQFGSHINMVRCASFSPNGKYIACALYNGTILLLNVIRGGAVCSPLQGHSKMVWSVAFSPDGNQLVSGSLDHTLRLWSVETGQQIGDPLTGHAGHVNSVDFSASGRYVVSGSSDSTVIVWRLDTKEALPLQKHTDIVQVVVCSPQTSQHNEYIVSGSSDKTICLWECTGYTFNHLKSFEGHTGVVSCLAFLPITLFSQSIKFISGSGDGSIRLWDAGLGSCIQVFNGQINRVNSVTLSLQSKYIVSASGSNKICVWNLETGDCINQTTHTENIHSVVSYGQLLACSTDRGIQLWVQEKQSPNNVLLSCAYNTSIDVPICISISSGSDFVATAFSNNNILVWVASTNMYISLRAPSEVITAKGGIALTFSSDGKLLAVIYPGNYICLWEIETMKILASHLLPGNDSNLRFISFSSDGKHVLTFAVSGHQQCWDVYTENSAIYTNHMPLVSREAGQDVMLKNIQFVWHPVKDNLSFGLWVVVDGRLVRQDKNGVVVIVPLTVANYK